MVSPIAGMAGVDSFATDVSDDSWRKGLLRQEPNGQAPLFALTAVMSSEKVTKYKHNWFTKSLPESNFTVTRVFTDPLLTTPYTGSGTANQYLYLQVSEENSKRVVNGSGLHIRLKNDITASLMAKVIGAPNQNGDSSMIPIRLLEADDNSIMSPAKNLSHYSGDNLDALIGASIHPDGGLRPQARAYQETEEWNYLQIHRTPLDLTRTKIQSNTRTVDPYQEAKRDAMIDHSKEWEWSMFFSERSQVTNPNNQKLEWTTRGLVPFIRANAADNYRIYNLETDDRWKGKTWYEGGWEWLLNMMELSFRYTSGNRSSDEKLVYMGNMAGLYINLLVQNVSSGFFIESGQMEFGIKVTKLMSDFGVWNLVRHPLWAIDPVYNRAMCVIEPMNLRYIYLQDTIFIEQANKEQFSGEGGYDGINEEFKTHAGLEVHYPNTMMFLGGIGYDNTLV